MTPADLAATLKRLGLSQSEAARRLGVSDRAMRYWLADDRPIPRMLELALKGLADARKPS